MCSTALSSFSIQNIFLFINTPTIVNTKYHNISPIWLCLIYIYFQKSNIQFFFLRFVCPVFREAKLPVSTKPALCMRMCMENVFLIWYFMENFSENKKFPAFFLLFVCRFVWQFCDLEIVFAPMTK
jgi:hypothetical protein